MDLPEEDNQYPVTNNQKQSNRHECLICSRVFATAYRLRRHGIVHSTEKKIFNCQFCEQNFRLHKELLMHEATHKRTLANINLKRCKICGIACYNENLLAHLKAYHEYFECDLCKKVYGTKSHLKLHMRIHINSREFKCSICPKTFNFTSQVKRHEISHSTTCVWYCEVCGVGFKNKPNLSHHMRSHNGEKPFQCDRCDRCFSHKQSLHLHIRIHDGDKPYICPWTECGRGFNDLTTMKVHTRLHTNENPYVCHLCGKTTKQASNLKSHYLHAHKIKDITSKTIRANARLYEKYKKEKVHEGTLLEVLSRQVTNQNPVNDPTIKQPVTVEGPSKNQLAPGQLHGNIVAAPLSSVVDKERTSNVISSGLDMVNPQEYSCDVEVSPSGIGNNQVDRIKEEVCDIIGATVWPVNRAIPQRKIKVESESLRNPTSSQKLIQKNIEKVNVNETHSEELDIKADCAKSGNSVDLFPITYAKESIVSCADTLLEPTNSEYAAASLTVRSSTQPSKFHCDVCPASYQQKSKLKAHIAQKHTMTEAAALAVRIANESLSTQPSKFHCNICPASYQQKSKLKAHFVRKHTVAEDGALIVRLGNESSSTQQPRFLCDVCPASYQQRSKLKVHIARKHTDSTRTVTEAKPDEKLKMCEICGKTFAENSALQKHLKFTHSNLRPFPCAVCGRAFKDSNGLKVHMRSHSGEKPYSCNFCSKRFSTSMGRNIHHRGHTGDKPYKCSYCDSAFSDNSTFKQHVRIHTNEKPYVCHICGKGATQAGNLKSHLRHAHKIHIKHVSMKREK